MLWFIRILLLRDKNSSCIMAKIYWTKLSITACRYILFGFCSQSLIYSFSENKIMEIKRGWHWQSQLLVVSNHLAKC